MYLLKTGKNKNKDKGYIYFVLQRSNFTLVAKFF